MKHSETSVCTFCDLANSAVTTDNPGAPYLIARVNGFMLLSEREPLAAGHALLVPDEHVSSLTQLRAERVLQAEQTAMRIADGFSQSADTGTLVVEHGTATGPHTALHILPTDEAAAPWFEEQHMQRIADVWNLTELSSLYGSDYIFAQQFCQTGAAWYGEELPPNWLYRLVVEQLGDDGWGWNQRLHHRGPEISSDAVRANLALICDAVRPRSDANARSELIRLENYVLKDAEFPRQRSSVSMP